MNFTLAISQVLLQCHAYSFSRLRRQLPRGGSLIAKESFSFGIAKGLFANVNKKPLRHRGEAAFADLVYYSSSPGKTMAAFALLITL